MLRFAGAMGLDYGEFDALRVARDGRLYIVDVNNTPDGPPNGLAAQEAEFALGRLADAFERKFLGEVRASASRSEA